MSLVIASQAGNATTSPESLADKTQRLEMQFLAKAMKPGETIEIDFISDGRFDSEASAAKAKKELQAILDTIQNEGYVEYPDKDTRSVLVLGNHQASEIVVKTNRKRNLWRAAVTVRKTADPTSVAGN